MSEQIALSTISRQPWNPVRFDQQDQLTFQPYSIAQAGLAVILNLLVVVSALRNKSIYAEVIAYASNMLYLALCISNATYMLFIFVINIMTYAHGHWSESACTAAASANVFFITYSVIQASMLTTERVFMVFFLRRMPINIVLVCLGFPIIAAFCSVALVAPSGAFIFSTGLNCSFFGLASWIGVALSIVLPMSLIYLICGSVTCYVRLRRVSRARRQRTVTASLDPSSPTLDSRKAMANGVSPRDARIERALATRGGLAVAALWCDLIHVSFIAAKVLTTNKRKKNSLTVIPITVMMVTWHITDRQAPRYLEFGV
ncbi:hypothetical protein BC828DRAFT_375868 [Blastocladiella britannica]|nr:hypothetical protein BC828DRAFT_375868 [Blastocladiella britannica]